VERPHLLRHGPRRFPALPWLVLLALLGACGGETVQAAPRRPSYSGVVLVTLDTLRADHVGCYGYPRPTSPCLDRLAAEGVLFTRALASTSLTAPSHAAILTGLPPALHGVLDNGQQLERTTLDLGELATRAGYATGAFLSTQFLRGVAGDFGSIQVSDRAERLVDKAASWVEQLPPEQPYLLWLHLYDVHQWTLDQRTPADELARLAREAPLDDELFRRVAADLHGVDPGEGRALEDVTLGDIRGEHGQPKTLAELRQDVERYDAQVRHADGQVERLYARLHGLRPDAPTLWIVTADHGEGLAGHGYLGHGAHIYDEQLHVPLIVHASDGSLAPRRVDALVQHIDLLPTLADVLGLPLPDDGGAREGRSLLGLLRGAEEPDERRAFAQQLTKGEPLAFALQSARRKALVRVTGERELYDLEHDPLELVDRAGAPDAEDRALLEDLERRLQTHARSAPAPGQDAVSEEWASELRALGY